MYPAASLKPHTVFLSYNSASAVSLIHSDFSVEKLLSLPVPAPAARAVLFNASPTSRPSRPRPLPTGAGLELCPPAGAGVGELRDVLHSDFLPAWGRAAPPSLCDPPETCSPSKRSSSA